MYSKLPKFILRLISKPPQLAYKLGLGGLLGRKILLLTATGRKSGLPRTTSLQYETIDGVIQAASGIGVKADWYKNVKVNPQVVVRIGSKTINAYVVTSTDLDDIIKYILHKLEQHPIMTRLIFLLDGIPLNPTRQYLEEYAQDRALIKIYPQAGN